MPPAAERPSTAPIRRRRLRRIVLPCLAAAGIAASSLLPGPLTTVTADELSDARARQEVLENRIAAQKAQVARLDRLQSRLREDIDEARTALRSVNADLAAVRVKVASIRRSIKAVQGEYDRLVAEVASLDLELGRLREEQARKQAQLRDRLDLLAARIRDAYEAGQTSMFETLLSSRSFTDMLVQAGAFLDVAEQDRRLAESIRRDRETLAGLEVMVQATRGQTDLLRQEAATQERQLDRRLRDLKAAQARLARLERETQRELAKQRTAFARLARNETALRQAIAANAAAQRKLQRRIEALVREQRERGNIPSEYSGTFVWPHPGRITQEFGCTGFPWEPPLGDCANFHRGIDIAAPRLTPVRAAGDGVVVFAGPNPYDPYPKAWIVIIAHSESLQTWYAHVDNERPPTVRAGQSVRQGQVIAYVGSTGRSTGYHTDWRVELRGSFVNPRLFL